MRFELEHIIPHKHGGSDSPANRAFACLHCNRHKGTDLAGIDWATSRTRLIRLFNPRRHVWDYHFAFDGTRIVAKTRIGRVTVEALQMNDPLMLAIRRELIDEGEFPI